MDYWIKKDFDLLQKWGGGYYDKNDEENVEVRKRLAKIYSYTENWAKLVQEKSDFISKNRKVDVTKAAFDAGQKFYKYHWAKMWPDKYCQELAYTVGIDAELGFEIKIDTIGLGTDETPKNKKDKIREKYEEIRKEKKDSSIVRLLKIEDGLAMSMEELVDWTISEFKKFTPNYDEICKELGLEMVKDAQSDNRDKSSVNKLNHPLNQILYGPAGTGKTYKTINHTLAIIKKMTLNELDQAVTKACSEDTKNQELSNIQKRKKLQDWFNADLYQYTEPYRVCRRLSILRECSDDKIKIYP